MGYDINRFREAEISEEFLCPICHDILEDPVLVENCEHVFCHQCINEWLQQSDSKSCPIDRLEISKNSLRPPQRSFRNLITSLLISCDFASNGCEEWVKIEELVIHGAKCSFNPVIMNQEIECPSGCGAQVKRCGLIDNHNCVVFLKQIISKKNDSIEELKNQNKLFIKELEHLNENLSVNNENLIKLTQTNESKDVIIRDLKIEIENLKKMNEEFVEMIRARKQSNSDSSQNSDFSKDNLENGNLIDFLEDFNRNIELTSNQNEANNTSEASIETSIENRQLIDALRVRGVLINRRVIEAMLSIDRGLFSPTAASYALHHIRSIGYGAHTGPSTYEAKLLQFIEPHLTDGCKVLDIGSGTGYLTSCIANMIKSNGRVIGIDHIPQLVLLSVETIQKHYLNLLKSGKVKLTVADGRFGFDTEAPYDLIFIEALTRRVPQKVIDQLKPGGSIIVPIGGREKDINLEQFTKQTNGEIVRLILCDDWSLMRENTLDLLEDKKLQLRSGWRVKLGF